MLFDSLPRPAVKVAPGVAHLPGWLDIDQQRALVEEFRETARAYAGTPMGMYKPQLKSGQMSVFQLHVGRFWHYGSYRYVNNIEGTQVPPMPESLAGLAPAPVTPVHEHDQERQRDGGRRCKPSYPISPRSEWHTTSIARAMIMC